MDYDYFELGDGTIEIIEFKVNSKGTNRFNGYNAFKSINTQKVETDIVIPDHIEGKPVSIIGPRAFVEARHIESVVIPDTVTVIRDLAFDYLENLKNLKLSNNLDNIGTEAFFGIGVEDLVIPGGTKTIGVGAFNKCNNLKNLIIENGVENIGVEAFNYCRRLKEINIPESVKLICETAFSYTSAVEKIAVDINNKFYDSRNNCNAIIETKTNKLVAACKNTVIPNDIEIIGKGAFYGVTALTKINIPESVREIGSRAFKHCNRIKKIVFPKNIEKISSQAINSCWNLETIVFEDITKLKSFFRNNFEGIPNLKEVIINGDISKKIARIFVEYSVYNNNEIFMKDEILLKLTKKDLKELIDLYKEKEDAPQMQKIIQIYNKKYCKEQGPNLRI